MIVFEIIYSKYTQFHRVFRGFYLDNRLIRGFYLDSRLKCIVLQQLESELIICLYLRLAPHELRRFEATERTQKIVYQRIKYSSVT